MLLGPDPVELELPMTANSVSVGILGATGYTGIELLRLLHGHPFARVDCMTSDRFAGQPIEAVFPHLRGRDLPTLSKIGDVLDELAAIDPELAEIVELKFFCGLSFAEIAAMRGVSERTIQRCSKRSFDKPPCSARVSRSLCRRRGERPRDN